MSNPLRFDRTMSLAIGLCAPEARGRFTGLTGELVDLRRDLDGRITRTVRIYANLTNPLDKLFGVYGGSSAAMSIQTTDPLGFYQHAAGGNTPIPLCGLEPSFPNLRYDSWLTIGNLPPLEIGINWGPFNAGGGITAGNGGLFQIPTVAAVCPVGGRLLIMQFTTGVGETVSGTINLSGTLSNGIAPCGTVPNGPACDAIGVSFSYVIASLSTSGTLEAFPSTLSLSVGGMHQLNLDLGDPDFTTGLCFAGDIYVIAGSLSPAPPCIPIASSFGGDALVVPVNLDGYTVRTGTCPGPPLLFGMCGTLDATGSATATLTFPAGLPSSLAGTTLYHAAVVFRSGVGFVHTSGATSLTLVL